MSILIKGMELPKSCDSCDLIQFDDEGFEAHCLLAPYYRWCGTPPDYRPEGCLLVEVPTPHGKLIDADELKKNMRNYYPSIDHLCCSQHVVTKRDIDCAPTIIEAEVSE